jgi:hypothetical protein
MGNYFSSIKLFQYLRDIGIGACGTVRARTGIPQEFRMNKNTNMEWDTRSGAVVGGVLVVFWQDNGPVKMLTTVHGMVGDDWELMRLRRRP